MMTRYEHIKGCLLGTAVADAIGLPREGLSRGRAKRIYGERPLRHALLAGRGWCSDDTEHTVMVGQALLAADGDPERFEREFARRLRWWFFRLPAGVGLATLRACLKLWVGVSPQRSGVWSAGNGPAMRSALLGVMASSDEHLAELVQVSTRITHTDPRAEQGAKVIAVIARSIVAAGGQQLEVDEVQHRALSIVEDTQFQQYLEKAFDAARQQMDPDRFAAQLGLENGISGFVVHTVPAAVYCWLAQQGDYRGTVETAVCLGGDSDTVGAIAGALAGTQLGAGAIPREWIDGLAESPCNVAWMDQLARALDGMNQDGERIEVPRVSWLLLLMRNVLFLLLVLGHGFRRLLPPY